jgi:hypothetical protein
MNACWADFRVTDYSRIEKWWSIVMSAYLMVSLQSEQLNKERKDNLGLDDISQEEIKKHPKWDEEKGWKNILNNLRLLIQPFCYLNFLKPWLIVFFKPKIIRLFCRLFFQLNRLINSFLESIFLDDFYYSSA